MGADGWVLFRRKAAAPESAVGDFDLPRAQVSSVSELRPAIDSH